MNLVLRIAATLCFLSVVSSCSTTKVASDPNAEASSYVIIGANAAREGAKQPTWIGAYQWIGAHDHSISSYRKTYIIHFPANRSVVKLPPGRYSLDHLDFGESATTEYGAKELGRSTYKFIVKPGVISFVGSLELEDGDVTMQRDSEIFKEACDIAPDIFSRLSIRDAFNTKREGSFRIDCNTLQVTPG